MSLQTYMDLIENPINNWISIFCKSTNKNKIFNCVCDKYCALFPEKINGENKCVMLYVDIVYPPFEKIDYKIANNKYLDAMIGNLYHHIREFYVQVVKSVLNDRKMDNKNTQILQNTGLCISDATHTLLPFPIDKDYVKKNMEIYDLEEYTERSYREIFNSYEKHAHRIGIHVEILDIAPRKNISVELLGNYRSISDSDSESITDTDTDSDSDILDFLE